MENFADLEDFWIDVGAVLSGRSDEIRMEDQGVGRVQEIAKDSSDDVERKIEDCRFRGT